MDGLKATEKTMQINPEAKVRIVTTHADQKLRKTGMSFGRNCVRVEG